MTFLKGHILTDPRERVVLEHCGIVDPENIYEVMQHGGYETVRKVLLQRTPEEVVDEVKASGLRGRGGAGFPTGLKWEFAAKEQSEIKYMVCNGDEGEPGTFKDRLLMEGDPHRIIEGMIIGGYAIGARYGYVYIRGEYAEAIRRFKKAVAQAEEHHLLGDRILNSDFSFHLTIHEGAGSYVCGEETALLESLEGRRGQPRVRPPFPAQAGLWGMPTNVNNVETLANIPLILLKGSSWFTSIGTESSSGTKLFTLSGHVRNRGTVEMPMGTTLRQLIEEDGGGMVGRFKAAQLGGSAGALLGEDMLDVPIDYASMLGKGAVLGSGALLVMNDTTCVVDMLKCFLKFFVHESCGKCAPCRVGTKQLYELACRLSDGRGTERDVDLMLTTAEGMKATSLCALGASPVLPISSILKYFKEEVMEHTRGICRAGVCY